MTITTLAGVRSGLGADTYLLKSVAGASAYPRLGTSWALSAIPEAGSYDATLAGVTLSDSTTGAMSLSATAGANTHLASVDGKGSAAGLFLICDRLWHNGGLTITSTSPQSITSPTWPARDEDGATDGKGVLLALEVSATTGSGSPTITVGYTNSEGVGGRTATNIGSTSPNIAIGCVYPIGLQAGDRGVRSVQSLTLSATWTSGTINLVAYRPIAMVYARTSLTVGRSLADVLSIGMPRIYDGSCLYIMGTNTVASFFHGIYRTAAG